MSARHDPSRGPEKRATVICFVCHRAVGADDFHSDGCPVCGAGRHLPPIRLLPDDARRLAALAGRLVTQNPLLVAALTRELARAVIVRDAHGAWGTARIGAELRFRLDGSAEPVRRRLHLPETAGQAAQGFDLSLATPLGIALVGLAAGAVMPFTDLCGTRRLVRLDGVRDAA
ncbi:hypothetical protein P7L75_16910 [Tistrella mobilis]|uniref:hypothetical protein n=1 Tax=Tistrella mobilis TaxID=171437 RepID=UPI003558E81A